MLEASVRFFLKKGIDDNTRSSVAKLAKIRYYPEEEDGRWFFQFPKSHHILTMPDKFIPAAFLESADKYVEEVSVKAWGAAVVGEGLRTIGKVRVSHVGLDWLVTGPTLSSVIGAIMMTIEKKLEPGDYDAEATRLDLRRENDKLNAENVEIRKELAESLKGIVRTHGYEQHLRNMLSQYEEKIRVLEAEILYYRKPWYQRLLAKHVVNVIPYRFGRVPHKTVSTMPEDAVD